MGREKRNNKGFSLVELIIVIAIMAILAAALAPQLMKYIEKSRIETDTHNCRVIERAISAALANDDIDKEVVNIGAHLIFDIKITDTMEFLGNPHEPPDKMKNELKTSLSSLKGPKQNGKSMYCCRVYVDVAKKRIKYVTVRTV